MVKLFVVMLAIMVSGLAGCAGPGGPGEVAPGQQFTLALGQSASIKGEQLRVAFVDVVSDSRCPRGANCVWQGEVSCLLEISGHGSTQRKVLTQPGLTDDPAKTQFEDSVLRFNVRPYPKIGTAIARTDYRIDLTFVRREQS